MMRRDVRRRLEQYVANPGCEANVLSAVHDIPMEAVARFLGLDAKVGQSVFAISRGNTFERVLFEDDAARLRKALIDKRVLPPNATGFVDLRIKKNSGPQSSLMASREAFLALLGEMASTSGERRMLLASIIAGPVMMVPGKAILPDGLFSADVLTVHPTEQRITLRVGEVKVYPDRGGFTAPAELSSMRAQAGLYVHVLRRELEQLGLDRAFDVALDGFLVLSRPGSNMPSVRAGEDLRYQAQRAEDAFERLREMAARELPIDEGSKLVSPLRLSVVQDAGKAYADDCLGFCKLADHCQSSALEAGEPVALGEDMARFLGTVSLHRAIALMHGAEAANEAEEDFLRRAG